MKIHNSQREEERAGKSKLNKKSKKSIPPLDRKKDRLHVSSTICTSDLNFTSDMPLYIEGDL
jgi:hypothetical protein